MIDFLSLAQESLEPRILKKINFDGPWSETCGSRCWEWTGAKSGGYGMVGYRPWGLRPNGQMSMFPAHRVIFHLLKSEIPFGMLLDHLCHNTGCVNPKHLRVASKKQNKEHIRGARSDSHSGILGVWWSERHQKWRVDIGHLGVSYYFGYYENIQLAEAVAIVCRSIIFSRNDRDFPRLPESAELISHYPKVSKYTDKAHHILQEASPINSSR